MAITNLRDAQLLDLLDADLVEIVWDADNHKLWVNVDGKCVLRIGKVKDITQRPTSY